MHQEPGIPYVSISSSATQRKDCIPLPVFLDVRRMRCLVAGGGHVALRKVQDLIESGARPVVVAVKPLPELERMADTGMVELHARRFRPEDLDDVRLVFAATDDAAVNTEIARLAGERGILVNAVDDPCNCDFFSSAVVKRGQLRIAVSTSGEFPALAASIKREIEALFPPEWAEYVQIAGEFRRQIIAMTGGDETARLTALRWLASREAFDLYQRHGKERVWSELTSSISS